MNQVFLIYGEEEFILKKHLDVLKKKLLGDDVDNNVSVYDLYHDPLDLVLEDCDTIPFLSEKKIVIANNPFFLTGEKVKTDFENNLDNLIKYIENPTDFSYLIFYLKAPKLDERKKVVKKLKGMAKVLEANALSDNELIKQLKKIASKSEFVISNDAVELLTARTGKKFGIAYQELGKLMLYKANEKEITVKDVDEMVSRSLEDNVFELIDYVLRKETAKSLLIYRDLLKFNEEPIKINAILASQFRLMLQCKVLYKRGYSQKEIASYLKVHPYRVKLAMEKANNYNDKVLINTLYDLGDIDFKIKSGQVNKELALELFFLS